MTSYCSQCNTTHQHGEPSDNCPWGNVPIPDDAPQIHIAIARGLVEEVRKQIIQTNQQYRIYWFISPYRLVPHIVVRHRDKTGGALAEAFLVNDGARFDDIRAGRGRTIPYDYPNFTELVIELLLAPIKLCATPPIGRWIGILPRKTP